jgi:hypothetical protein
VRIHSKFHDYYDSAMGYGQDSSLHYQRKQEQHKLSEVEAALPEPFRHFARRRVDNGTSLDYETFIVGFCGRLYPAVHTWDRPDTGEHCYIYEPKELLAFGKKHYGQWLRESFDEAVNLSGVQHDSIFLKVDAPIFTIEELSEFGEDHCAHWLITNSWLKAVEFFKVVDAFTAFQEIAMYLSNQLVKHDEVLEVADKYKIAQHGYDKHSFRKEKRSK